MSSIIMPAFHVYHQEAAIIGRLLAGYGELEFLLCRCVAATLGGDLSKATRILFRSRGEEHRISAADARRDQTNKGTRVVLDRNWPGVDFPTPSRVIFLTLPSE